VLKKLGDAMGARPTIRLHSAIILIWIASAWSAFSQTRQVVLLYDERIDLPGLASLNAGFTRALTAGSAEHVEIYREEMDLSRFDSPAYRDLLRNELRTKYAAKKIDVVVAVMAPAFEFFLSYRDEIFPGIPIVFCPLDRTQLGGRSLPVDVTGVLVKREFAPTVDLVAHLHPDTERIVVVAGTSELDSRLLAQAREEFKPFEKRFAFTYLTNLPLPELLSRLSQLPPKTVVLYTTMFRDGAGQAYMPHDVAERISASANAPVYGFLDQYVGHGIVGGQVYGFARYGEQAAELVLKILSGRTPQQLPPIQPANSVTMFDARQLQRWKINEHRLPVGSTVLFREPTIWDRYHKWIIAGASILIAQALLIFGLLMNILRRRRAEGSLVESEARFQTMADAAPCLIWMSGPDKLCTFFNRAWLEFTGRTMEQERGNGWSQGVHHDDFDKCLQTYVDACDARQPFVMQYRLRRRDGEYRWLTDKGAPRFGKHGKFRGYIGACVDITDLLNKEEEVRKSREQISRLSRVNLLGETTASIAHELNQPLTGITSNASAAQRFIDRGNVDIAQLREILVDIGADGRRASDIIHHIRNTIKKGEPTREQINLNEIAVHVARMLQPDARLNSCELSTSLANDLSPIEGDPIEIQQVLINLVSNAFEAMHGIPPNQRKVEIVTEKNGEGTVRMSVRDYGAGISEEAHRRMFEQFFTTKEEGLGMGLAIVRSIIEAHGGKISAENINEGGARFYVVLPTTEK